MSKWILMVATPTGALLLVVGCMKQQEHAVTKPIRYTPTT
jgi:hypothetical protein